MKVNVRSDKDDTNIMTTMFQEIKISESSGSFMQIYILSEKRIIDLPHITEQVKSMALT